MMPTSFSFVSVVVSSWDIVHFTKATNVSTFQQDGCIFPEIVFDEDVFPFSVRTVSHLTNHSHDESVLLPTLRVLLFPVFLPILHL